MFVTTGCTIARHLEDGLTETSWLQSSPKVTADDAAPTCRKTLILSHCTITPQSDDWVSFRHFIDELLIAVMFPVEQCGGGQIVIQFVE